MLSSINARKDNEIGGVPEAGKTKSDFVLPGKEKSEESLVRDSPRNPRRIETSD